VTNNGRKKRITLDRSQRSEVTVALIATVRRLVPMLMLVIEIPLAANTQRSTPNAERRIKEDRNQRSETDQDDG
jgi:hypothetical protein